MLNFPDTCRTSRSEMRSAETAGVVDGSSNGTSAGVGYGPRAAASTSFNARRGGILPISAAFLLISPVFCQLKSCKLVNCAFTKSAVVVIALCNLIYYTLCTFLFFLKCVIFKKFDNIAFNSSFTSKENNGCTLHNASFAAKDNECSA